MRFFQIIAGIRTFSAIDYFLNWRQFCVNALLFCENLQNSWYSEFWIELHSTPAKIRKLSLLIGSKNLPHTLRNFPALHENRNFFVKGEFLFIKANISGKPRIFPWRESPAVAILFNEISKFWARIPPYRTEIQALELAYILYVTFNN